MIAKGSDCTGAVAKDTTINGSTDHNNMVSNAFTVYAKMNGAGPPPQAIAFEYQTYGGQEYIQFFVTGSASGGVAAFQMGVATSRNPIVPFNGNVFNALQTAATIANVAASALPPPLNLVKPGVAWSNLICNSNTWAAG